jgi:hypothetical protein
MAKWLSEAYRDFGLSILSLGQADGDAVGKVPIRPEDGSQEDATTEPTRAFCDCMLWCFAKSRNQSNHNDDHWMPRSVSFGSGDAGFDKPRL